MAQSPACVCTAANVVLPKHTYGRFLRMIHPCPTSCALSRTTPFEFDSWLPMYKSYPNLFTLKRLLAFGIVHQYAISTVYPFINQSTTPPRMQSTVSKVKDPFYRTTRSTSPPRPHLPHQRQNPTTYLVAPNPPIYLLHQT
jgi:hypothetical protein